MFPSGWPDIHMMPMLLSLQVGLMLRGMGFTKDTSIYLASGKIYNAEKNMAPLLEMFPNLQTKETLASEEELAPFKVGVCALTCTFTFLAA